MTTGKGRGRRTALALGALAALAFAAMIPVLQVPMVKAD